jgi:hypothetical protein
MNPVADPECNELRYCELDRRERIYAELGVPPEEPEDPLDRWRRIKAEREEPPPRERKLDTVPPTLDDIDRRPETPKTGRIVRRVMPINSIRRGPCAWRKSASTRT